MRQPHSLIAVFFLRALVFLVASLAVWYWARNLVVMPVAAVAEWGMRGFFPGWVSGSELDGITPTLLTRLPIAQADGRIADLAPETRVLTYCYGLPLLLALFLAARAKGLWWKLPLCALGLLPFQAWGVCFAWLVQVAVQHGSLTRPTTYFNEWSVNLIGLGYQIGFLLLPTLVPMLMWLYFERRFVIAVAVAGAIEGTVTR